MKLFHTTKFKILIATVICIMLIGSISNLLLYHYLNTIIIDKSDKINEANVSTVFDQLQLRMDDILNLFIVTSIDSKISSALRYDTFSSQDSKVAMIEAQKQLDNYLASNPSGNYVTKLMIFNDSGLFIHSSKRHFGSFADLENLMETDFIQQYSDEKSRQGYFMDFIPSTVEENEISLAIIAPVQTFSKEIGYLYLELSPDLLTDVFKSYSLLHDFYVVSKNNFLYLSSNETSDKNNRELYLNALEAEINLEDTNQYQVRVKEFSNPNFSLYCFTNISDLTVTESKNLLIISTVFLSSLVVAVFIATILSNYITQPIKHLISRLRRISDNDFSFDPTIEKSQDEIGQIGKVVNEMTVSITDLLKEKEELYEQQKNIEIELLLSQINPHFLYNTLDSINWMAIISKNPGIANMTKGLSNLLKNIAKGAQDKIPLRDELSLLKDYVAIQSIRYVETFEFTIEIPDSLMSYTIPKFSLQPLVENAVFHGIEPTGNYGFITVSAQESQHDLKITVEDTGFGILPEKIDTILKQNNNKNNSSLSGIGLSNVHTRLQLLYGANYGLSVESNYGEYTRIHVTIPKEMEDRNV